jgi:glycosyltransferase involved in cell wall biosynthesis
MNGNKVITAISVVVITKNEAARLGDCLRSLNQYFSDIHVVDSASTDETAHIAKSYGARVTQFNWNGRYPKKYEWCLDHLEGVQDWILFVDADEFVTPELARELSGINLKGAGYFIRSRYKLDGKVLRFGLKNNKLCLINRHKMKFPHINDLDIEEMGEVEGHYQPVRRSYFARERIGRLKAMMVHDAYADMRGWAARHARYARWEAKMNSRDAWPLDPVIWRDYLKRAFRGLPRRDILAFIHSYIIKAGFLDGRRGWMLAKSRYIYYRMIRQIELELRH